MLRAKKAKEEAAAAAVAAADASSSSTSSAAPALAAAPKMSLLGGDEKKTSSGAPIRKMKPSEIRIQKDITELDAGKVGNVEWPEPSDLTNMKLTVRPDKGLWAGAPFTFSIRIPDGYPHEPPKVLCETKIYHPNIDLEGHVCLNILRDEWKPIYDCNTVIYGLIYLFYEPNANDPLNHEAAQLMRDDKATFEANVRSSLRGGTLRIHQKTGGTITVAFPKLL